MELDFYCIHDDNGKKIEFQMVALAVEMRVHPPLFWTKTKEKQCQQGRVMYSNPVDGITAPILDRFQSVVLDQTYQRGFQQ